MNFFLYLCPNLIQKKPVSVKFVRNSARLVKGRLSLKMPIVLYFQAVCHKTVFKTLSIFFLEILFNRI